MTSPTTPDIEASDRTQKRIYWLHYIIVIIVFGITGFLSVLFSRFLLNGVLNLEGEVWSGPWSYRIIYLLLIPASYSVMLVAVGTLFGKHSYFKQRVLRMWGRLMPRRMYVLLRRSNAKSE